MLRRLASVVAASLALALAIGGGEARANETDPWYAWVHPPRDGRLALNRAIGDRFAGALRDVNARRDVARLECRDVARSMTTPVRTAAFFFHVGDLAGWHVDYSPRSSEEYFDSLSMRGAYRHLVLLPLDPSMRAGDVLFGTDKLGHFFTNGLRQYDRYRKERAAGASEESAMAVALDMGIHEEKTWLGLYSAGIFSYADLEADHQGLLFFRALCDGGELAFVDGAWRLSTPFDIARWVSPCWDEAFEPSYFSRGADAAKAGLREMCADLDVDSVRERLERYRATGCTSESTRVVRERVARGELPDPSPWSLDVVCAGHGTGPQHPTSTTDRGGPPHLRSRDLDHGARTSRP